MNHLRPPIVLAILLLCAALPAQDNTAEAYFNRASKEYVKQDKMLALRTLDEGLQKYPTDPKLLKLAEELVKQEEKDQQQQQQQKEQQQKQDQQKKDSEQKEQQGENKEQQQKEKDQREKPQEQAEQGQQKEPNGQPRSGTIAPQDALRMLDALERSEKDVQEKVRARRRPAVRRNIEKDW